MRYPIVDNVQQNKEISTTFAGYDHRLSCREGYFLNEKNITSDFFPMLSTRRRRANVTDVEKFQGFFATEDTGYYVSNGELFAGGTVVTGLSLDNSGLKTFVRMGDYLVIFPDKVWYKGDGTYGNIEATKSYTSTSITFQQVNSLGANITLWNGQGDPSDGAYRIDTKDGKSTLQVYSKTANTWANVATTYFKITASGIDTNFKKGDGVKITADFTGISWDAGKNIFVNDEGNGKRSNNFAIHDIGSNYIIVTGLLDAATKTFTFPSFVVERKCPDMAYVVECQNRLWGCDEDGHEIYASKLGDPTNWNCFAGISTDSWAATVGSDGVWTGAYSYMGYPLFFKEESLLKVTISAYGAHSYRETVCRGVQYGSSKSLVQLNELLYYKSPNDVCVYDGNFPQEIGEVFTDKFTNAVGGGYDNKYYLAMHNVTTDSTELYTYDAVNYLWCRQDDIDIIEFVKMPRYDSIFFAKWKNATDATIIAVNGEECVMEDENATLEGFVDWEAESGTIGYQMSAKKYLSRFDVRMKMEVGAEAWLYVEYDSSGNWEYVWNVSGKGTKTFAIPVRPRRCDHFRYKLKGKGDCKLISFEKVYEEGSDM